MYITSSEAASKKRCKRFVYMFIFHIPVFFYRNLSKKSKRRWDKVFLKKISKYK